MSLREVIEGLLYQGRHEEIIYTINVSAWDDAPADDSEFSAYDNTNNAWLDVTTTILNSTSGDTVGTTITTPTIQNLSPDHLYQICCKFTGGDSNVYECYFRILGEY